LEKSLEVGGEKIIRNQLIRWTISLPNKGLFRSRDASIGGEEKSDTVSGRNGHRSVWEKHEGQWTISCHNWQAYHTLWHFPG